MKENKEKIRVFSALLIVIIIVIILIVQSRANQEHKYSSTFYDVFDTVTTVTGYAPDEEAFLENVGEIKKELLTYHQLFDKYHTYEGVVNIATLNNEAASGAVAVNEQLYDFLKYCKEGEQISNGLVNVGMGSVLDIWHDYREGIRVNEEGPNLPDMKELLEANQHVNLSNLQLDDASQMVSYNDPLFQLDVGAVAKGYAVEQVADDLRTDGKINVLLNVGGNVCAVGEKPDGSAWNIGIQNPDTESVDTYIAKVSVRNESVVTSGDYQRYYEVDGVRYCHIIDPLTLMPAKNCRSVTVLTKDSAKADLWSTMLFNMTIEEGMQYVEDHEELEAMWVDLDNKLVYSSGFGDSNEEE